MRLCILALVLVALAAPARADMVEYNMTGTITSTSSTSFRNGQSWPSPFANGDHITWTLQYDRSTPPSVPGTSSYSPTDPVITNVADQTKGFSDLAPSYHTFWAQNSLALSSSASGSSLQAEFRGAGGDFWFSAELKLAFKDPLGSQLDQVQLSSVPSAGPASYFKFAGGGIVASNSFTASVDSISPVNAAPEPGALTLVLLGVASLAVRRRAAISFFRESHGC